MSPTERAVAAVDELYRTHALPPPVVLTATDTEGFLRELQRAGPGPGAGAVWLLLIGSLPPGVVALAAWLGGVEALEIAVLAVMLGCLVIVTVYGPAPGADPPVGRARADRLAALLAAGLAGLAALAASGSPARAALAFGAAASLAGVARSLLLANGGLPGRLGLLVHPRAGPGVLAGRPAAGLGQALAPAGHPRALALVPEAEAAAPGWARLEELGRRRFDWDQVEPAVLLGGLLPPRRRIAAERAPAAARDLEALCDAAALFERAAVLLLPAAGPVRRPKRFPREPHASILRLLGASAVLRWLVAAMPSRRAADRALARFVADEPDPALRLEAIERLGPERFFAALGARPLDRSAAGALFVAGPPPFGTALVRVEDRVPDETGRPRVHWLPVPPHVATAREAVAWTFGKTEREYAPWVET